MIGGIASAFRPKASSISLKNQIFNAFDVGFWYDYREPDNMTKSDPANEISVLNDVTGNGNHATQGTASMAAIYTEDVFDGYSAGYYGGDDEEMERSAGDVDITGDFTWFWIGSYDYPNESFTSYYRLLADILDDDEYFQVAREGFDNDPDDHASWRIRLKQGASSIFSHQFTGQKDSFEYAILRNTGGVARFIVNGEVKSAIATSNLGTGGDGVYALRGRGGTLEAGGYEFEHAFINESSDALEQLLVEYAQDQYNLPRPINVEGVSIELGFLEDGLHVVPNSAIEMGYVDSTDTNATTY